MGWRAGVGVGGDGGGGGGGGGGVLREITLPGRSLRTVGSASVSRMA